MATSVSVAPQELGEPPTGEPVGPGGQPRASFLRRVSRDRFAVVGLVLLVLLLLVAVLAELLAPYDPKELFVGEKFEGRSSAHWFGTDHLGRDNLSRIIFGARVAVRVALQVNLVVLAIAVPVGLLAGFLGGRIDSIAMRVMDAIHSIPTLVLALALASAFGMSFNWALFGISLAFTPTMARLVRGQTLQIREENFIEASYAIGTPVPRMLWSRVLHNVASPIIVQTSVYLGGAILIEAGLSILGVGLSGGEAAWGSMLSEAFRSINTDPASVFYPGAAIALTVLAGNILGDGLRDAFGLDVGERYGTRTRMGLTSVDRNEPGEEAVDADSDDSVLSVDGLTVTVGSGASARDVVQNVTFSVGRGEIVGLVGESGCGKTVMSMSVMRLLSSPPFRVTQGSVDFGGVDLLSIPMSKMRQIRGSEISMIFQDPMAALNPSIPVGRQVAEAIRIHEPLGRRDAQRRAVELFDRVGIADARARISSYPHELSGGMRQRVMIAMALAASPQLLIADEPTTALDVTIQAQIIELLESLRDDLGLSIIFVTHDLGVVADVCDRVLVMYAGQLVEQADSVEFFARPRHPYSQALLAAMPRLDDEPGDLVSIPGSVPVDVMPSGCRFHPRCEYAIDQCRSGVVEVSIVGRSTVRCLRAQDLAASDSEKPISTEGSSELEGQP